MTTPQFLAQPLIGWARFWLALTLLCSSLPIISAIWGDWDRDSDRIQVAVLLLCLIAIFFFLFSLLLRGYFTLVAWVMRGFDPATCHMARRHARPVLWMIGIGVVIGMGSWWLSDRASDLDLRIRRDGRCGSIPLSVGLSSPMGGIQERATTLYGDGEARRVQCTGRECRRLGTKNGTGWQHAVVHPIFRWVQ